MRHLPLSHALLASWPHSSCYNNRSCEALAKVRNFNELLVILMYQTKFVKFQSAKQQCVYSFVSSTALHCVYS